MILTRLRRQLWSFSNRLGLSLCLLLLFPGVTFGAVRLNEVAWMGTLESQFGEWIELFNDSDSEVDLTGFILAEGGGATTIITLTKKIAPRAFYVIERTTASSPDPVPGVSDDAGTFVGGGLSNSGEFLVLKNAQGITLDQVDATAGWPGGDATTKQTMQWDGARWITATATPRTTTPSVSQQTQTQTQAGTSTNTTTGSTTTTETQNVQSVSQQSASSAHASPVPLSVPGVVSPVLLVEPGRNRLGSTGKPVVFEAHAFLKDFSGEIRDATFSWTFGDGGAATGKIVEHAYQFPGSYNVVVNAARGDERAVGRAVVRIVDAGISIVRVVSEPQSLIELGVGLGAEVNVGKTVIRSSRGTFVFPEDTILASGARLALSSRVLGFKIEAGDRIEVLLPDGSLVASSTVPVLVASRVNENPVSNTQVNVSIPVAPRPAQVAPLEKPTPPVSRAKASEPALLPEVVIREPEIIVEIPKPRGFLEGILALPGRAAAYLGSFF